MKLAITKKYFDQIKLGKKKLDYRDAHITFICEDTGETLRKQIIGVKITPRPIGFYDDVLGDDEFITFTLK